MRGPRFASLAAALLLVVLPLPPCVASAAGADPIVVTPGGRGSVGTMNSAGGDPDGRASAFGVSSTRSLLQAPSWHPINSARRGDRPTSFDASKAASTTPAAPVVGDDDTPAAPAEPVYHEMPHRAGVVEGCVTYLWQPRVNTSHHVEGRATRSQKTLGCNKLRKYRDYLDLGVVAVDLGEGDDAGTRAVDALAGIPGFGGMEAVVVVEGPQLPDADADAARHEKMYGKLPSENHFLVYSTSVLGPARAFNRAVKLAHAAQLVVLVTGATVEAVTGEWIKKATAAFDERPALVMIGGGGAGGGGGGGGGLTLTEELGVDAPVMVRRTAFLNLGLFAHPECPGGCGGNFVGELATRAWLAG